MIYAPATALARQGALGVILGIAAQALLATSCLGSALDLLDLVRGGRFEPADAGLAAALGGTGSGGISPWIQNISGLPKDFSAALR
jgi:hypothetical protein